MGRHHIEIRPTVPEDIPHVIGEPLPYRIRCLTLVVDGEVMGLGGLTFPPDGRVLAFVQQKPGTARRFPVASHRCGLMAMRMIAKSGVRRVFAEPDEKNPAAVRWLERLGFRRVEVAGNIAFVWEAPQC